MDLGFASNVRAHLLRVFGARANGLDLRFRVLNFESRSRLTPGPSKLKFPRCCERV